MKSARVTKIARGYARDESDSKRLKAAGVNTIYRADKGETLDRFKMRAGEFLGVVDGLRVFGGKRDIGQAIKLIHSWGCVVIDAETGLQSRHDGVEMMRQALAPKLRPGVAEEMQALSVKSRIDDGRLTERKAKMIWHNLGYTVAEAMELTGWPQSTMYFKFGPRRKRLKLER